MSSHRKRSRAAGVTRALHHALRGSPAQRPKAAPVDRWGYHYECISFAALAFSEPRESHNLPINGEYDSFSPGPDGWTGPSHNYRDGRDDIVRGPDGEFVGLARDY